MKLLLLLSLLFAFTASEADIKQKEIHSQKHLELSSFDHTHSDFSAVLKNFVVVTGAKSEVNYESLKASPSQLNGYLKKLSSVKKDQFAKWTTKQKMAFWINAYNAFTLKLILKNYPLKSIKDIGGLFSSPWKKKFFKIFGEESYLDKIEHQILRKRFNEPRIHFAVNCASIGCPALLDEAFVADKLDQQLETQTRLFLKDSSRNRIDFKKKRIYISKIFDWFEEDFTKGDMTVQKFVSKYLHLEASIESFSVSYTDYDWKLNVVSHP